jgi:hemerythrin-like domain-containing protein
MQRYNTFNQIHKALRALLYDAALTLQQTDFALKGECDAAVEKVVAILDLLENHAHQEDNQILPAIFDFEPSVVDAFEQEHVKDGELSRALENTIAELYRSGSLTEKVRLGRQLTSGFIQFMIFNLNHMAKEEEVLNEILWRYYSDEEIKKIEAVIKQSTPPEKQPFVAKWMLRGISNTEAVIWLKELQHHAPPALFQKVFSLAEAELPATRFQQIATHFFSYELSA